MMKFLLFAVVFFAQYRLTAQEMTYDHAGVHGMVLFGEKHIYCFPFTDLQKPASLPGNI